MMPLPEDLSSNSSFSPTLPGLQIAIDSTSLGEFKTCPRRYYYSIIWGWVPKEENVHLRFGLLLHEARERYDRLRATGADHDDALERVLDVALKETWNRELGRPWISSHPAKNRGSLIRSIVWYLDALGQNDPLETIIDAEGKPLVELSFRFDSGYYSATGESVVLCGHGDRIAKLAGDAYWVDVKTTKSALDMKYFAGFTPHNQFSLYDIAGQVVYHQKTRGVIVDALQVGATFTRFKRHPVPRTEQHREEWIASFGWWFRLMEQSAQAQDWPMNESSCDLYGGCRFREICSKSPSSREQWLDQRFTRRSWDPLQRRGDY